MPKFVDSRVASELTDAVKHIELRSSAEIVVVVRHHSGSYLPADLLLGIGLGLGTLAFMLFSPWFAFGTVALFFDPLVVGILAGLLSTQLPWWRHLATPTKRRAAQVTQAAQANFYSHRIRMTSGRTGILVYVSLLERAVELCADTGVTDALGAETVAREGQRIERALNSQFTGHSLASAITKLGDACEGPLPCSEDDVNELSDEVIHG